MSPLDLILTAAVDNTGTFLVLAVILLVAAIVLFVSEILLVSFGILGVGAAICAVAAVGTAYQAGTGIGHCFVVITPIAAILMARWGIKRVGTSPMAVKAEIDGEAGYHHKADSAGAIVGADGVLVTDARPSGRARFTDGQVDVQVRGGALDKGTFVRVIAIDGPIIHVIESPSES